MDKPSLSALAAWQINQVRKKRRISHAKLAPECARLGAPQLTERALGNIEQRRREITFDELLVIAAALNVPPILLLFPPEVPTVLLPGQRRVDTWRLARWFTGEAPMPSRASGWEEGAAPAILHRLHDRHVKEWQQAYRLADVVSSGQDAAEVGRRLRAYAGERLHAVRDEMRRRGLSLPALPEGIDVDGAQAA